MAALTEAGMSAAHAAEAIRNEEPAAPKRQAVPEPDPRALAIAEAAKSFDEAACVAAIRDASGSLEWAETVERVLMPAMELIGKLWERGELSLAVEHFASQLVRREMLAAISALEDPSADQPLVLLACPEDEWHDLGATAFWLLLRQRGVRVIFLGADLPAEALVSAVKATSPDSVCLSGIAPTSAPMLAEAARRLLDARISARVLVGGPALRFFPLDRVMAPRLPDRIDSAVDALLGLSGATKGALTNTSGSE
jgi:methanogenic corrinoid protein MtbC1